jgi:dolichyl-diphosphooligosaccharide--protein glycosyltransferase
MIRNIKSAGGGIHGIRRGINFLHIFGILFVAFLIILPNAYLAFDAAIPGVEKPDVFGDLPSGAFGTTLSKEAYWIDAFSWLKEQDSEIKNKIEKPAFISWWDYGFYEVAIGDHPTVADNFQDGIPPAANFHTATSEKEAVIVWIVRLLKGNAEENNGKLSSDVVQTLENRIGINNSMDIVKWIENPESSPSYNTPIGAEYNENLSKDYPVGQQWSMNAVYHDVRDLLDYMNDNEITWLYRNIQKATSKSIRYYGVEGYDKQIFNIFGFLADKSLVLPSRGGLGNPEDDYVVYKFVTQNQRELNFTELENLTDEEIRQDPPIETREIFKDPYFETMFYKTYVGISEGEPGSKTEPEYQLPCMNMKHFYAEYISPPEYMYYRGQAAVVIAKYYAGAYINGSVKFDNVPIDVEVVVQRNITQYGIEIPIEHDQNITSNGNFSVIVPAGNITLQIRRNTELGQNAFVLKNVTFDDAEESELSPITDDEAMRFDDDFERIINISIDPTNIEGYVYLDTDDNDLYNISIDEPLKDIKVTLIEITEFDPNSGQPLRSGSYKTLTTDENGYYNISGWIPGFYLVRAEMDGFVIHESYIQAYSGNKTYNISKPEPGNV